MRILLAVASTLPLLLAGCASEAPGVDAATIGTASRDAADAPWALAAEGTLGWVAGAGAHVYAGDLIVGVRSHDQCPRATWTVPEGATRLVVELGAGPGPVNLAVGGAKEVSYTTTPDGSAVSVEAAGADAGVWSAELKPVGVAASQTRPLRVLLEGSGAAPSALTLQPDPDCLL